MALYVFPDPRAEVSAVLNAAKASRFPSAAVSTAFPSSLTSGQHIQHAWDGTPSQQVNRQNATIRVTVWTPKGKVSEGIDLAQLVLAVLLDSGSASAWRFRPGAGPLPGVDSASGLPFCTFTVTAETRPHAVA